MNRFRLFAFFTGMATLSLLSPKRATQLIADAQVTALNRATWKRAREVFPDLGGNPEAPWQDHAPVESGFYRLTCEENDGEVDVVLVETDQYGILAAFDTDFGTLAVSDFHDGLTNPRWQKMEAGE